MNTRPVKVLLVIALSVVLGCAIESGTSEGGAPVSRGQATSVYFNGDIVTVNAAKPGAEAVAIRDGVILAVGDREEVAAKAGKETNWIDLRGNTLVPGLIDAHGHITFTALNQASVNVSSPPVGPAETIADIISLLQANKTNLADEAWLTGWGYDDSLLAEKRHPTREDLDKISTDIAIALRHVSGHFITCNSRCLELAGITA
ncbi:MAG: amidohydrolase family protein, partial [Halieaceae bacterium]|nr:amidohydrolase family protein [Halieaceae bacterium]